MKYSETKEHEKAKMSIIGRNYMPNDNSWQLNLTKRNLDFQGMECDMLAGTAGTSGQTVTVVSEPFEINIDWQHFSRKKKTFVIVEDKNGFGHITLFSEESLL